MALQSTSFLFSKFFLQVQYNTLQYNTKQYKCTFFSLTDVVLGPVAVPMGSELWTPAEHLVRLNLPKTIVHHRCSLFLFFLFVFVFICIIERSRDT